MRIGFDISQTGQGKAGCGYFADGLIREIASSDSDNEYILYPAMGEFFWDPECATSTFSCNAPNLRRMQAPADFERLRRFWRDPGKDFEERLGNPEIIHANNFYCPRGLKTARLVYTLYDLSFLHEPSWSTEQNRTGCFEGVFRASISADWIVAISEYSKQHFLSTFPHFPEERMTVIYPASRFEQGGPAERPQSCEGLGSGGFWLTVGTIEPRKNYRRLLDAYRILKTQGKAKYPLLVVGGQGWLSDGFASHLQGLDLGSDVILAGYVSDPELRWLFQNCFGFVYPSLFEGFGMPVLEALGLGAPVLCSNTSSLPEAAGEAALYFDPLDPESIADTMARFAAGEVDRENLKSVGLGHAKKFSWARSAGRLRELYERTLHAGR